MQRGRCGSAIPLWHARTRMRLRPFAALLAMTISLGTMPTAGLRADDTEPYRFGPGDRLRITILDDPAISGEFTVQQSGSILLPSVGRIQVVGREFDDLQQDVMARLRESGLIEPQMSIEVAEYRPIYVVGDVNAPGSYPFQMGMTVLQALAVAGGFRTLDNETLSDRLELLQAQDVVETIDTDRLAALARRARLLAERDGAEGIQFPPEIVDRQEEAQIAGMMDSERRLFETGRSAIAGEIAILENQKRKLHDEIANLEAQLEAIARRDQLIETELRDVEYLFGKGLTAKTRVLELQRLQTDVVRDRLDVAASVTRAQQDISKVDLSIVNLRNERLNRILGDLDATQKEISQLEVRRRTAKEILTLRQAMSTQPAVRLVVSGEGFVITRDRGSGPEDMAATDRSYVLPGDVVRVSRFDLSSTARVDEPAAGIAGIEPMAPVAIGQ